jgi:hypothetical protein
MADTDEVPPAPVDEKTFTAITKHIKEVSTPGEGKEAPRGTNEEQSQRRPFGYVFHQILCFIWLAPAIALIWLNLTGYIIGASIGCFSCRLNPFSSATFEEESKLDKRDHTAVGGLQFASKAMEIWFMVVAAGLIYDYLILLTKPDHPNGRGRDIPLGLLARYVQFGDILELPGWIKGEKTRRHHMFLVFIVVMCIIANLIGPSTAVLMIPTIQWLDASDQTLGIFGGLASQQPPQDAAVGKQCSVGLLAAGKFSCTASPYEYSLDQLFASVAGSLGQLGQTQIIFDPVISQEQQVSFIVNTTDIDVDWIPSRQAAREISADYLLYSNGVKNGTRHSNYSTLSNSLSTILVRDGPTIGLAGGCYSGSLSNVSLSADKSVRCYGGWNLYVETGSTYTKCISVGSGWADPTFHSNFFLEDINGQITGVDVYFASHVFTPILNDSPCFIDGKPQNTTSCDWDQAFLAAPPNTHVTNTSTNIVLVEYSVPNVVNADRTVWCDDIAYLGFQRYLMDPSPFTNFIHLTQLENADPKVAPDAVPLVVNTDWWLAGWSVDRGGTVNSTSIAAQTMISLAQETYNDSANALALSTLNFMDGVAADQALSMINYQINTTFVPSNADAANPALTTGAKVQVWAYGLGSHTSRLGIVIVFIATVLVVVRLILALAVVVEGQNRYTTPTPLGDLFVAALKHVPVGDDAEVEEDNVRVMIRKRTLSFAQGESGESGV